MKKYNLSSIMKAAWGFFRKGVASFSVALRMAWANAKTHNVAKDVAAISEETHTWYGWKQLGYEVIHESKACIRQFSTDPPQDGTARLPISVVPGAAHNA